MTSFQALAIFHDVAFQSFSTNNIFYQNVRKIVKTEKTDFVSAPGNFYNITLHQDVAGSATPARGKATKRPPRGHERNRALIKLAVELVERVDLPELADQRKEHQSNQG